jgi:hypothetical protein
MEKIMYYYTTGLNREEIEYSDKALVELVQKLSKEIDGFKVISMWFSQKSDTQGEILIDLGTGEGKLQNHKTFTLFEFDLMEEEFSDYVKEGQRIKRMLQRKFPGIKVTSDFH